MKYVFGAALLGLAAAVGPARADLQMVPALGGGVGSVRVVLQPIVLSPPSPRMMRRVTPPAIAIANGFGRQVPLAFAARQIVPAGVKTTFGPDVDQSELVDWTGGGPWIGVLRNAVQPLGLHVTVRWMAVSITAD